MVFRHAGFLGLDYAIRSFCQAHLQTALQAYDRRFSPFFWKFLPDKIAQFTNELKVRHHKNYAGEAGA